MNNFFPPVERLYSTGGCFFYAKTYSQLLFTIKLSCAIRILIVKNALKSFVVIPLSQVAYTDAESADRC